MKIQLHKQTPLLVLILLIYPLNVLSQCFHKQPCKSIEPLVEKYAGRYDVPANLVKAVIWVESRCDQTVVSHKGAIGLMQLMPKTAKALGMDIDKVKNNAEENIKGGVKLLRSLLNDCYMNLGNHCTLENVLAGYNAGPYYVTRPIYKLRLPKETKNYITRIKACIEQLKFRIPHNLFTDWDEPEPYIIYSGINTVYVNNKKVGHNVKLTVKNTGNKPANKVVVTLLLDRKFVKSPRINVKGSINPQKIKGYFKYVATFGPLNPNESGEISFYSWLKENEKINILYRCEMYYGKNNQFSKSYPYLSLIGPDGFYYLSEWDKISGIFR